MKNGNKSNASDRHSSFYAERRKYTDEILFCRSLKPADKILALAIAQAVNRETNSTFMSLSTFAQRLGIKLAQARQSAKRLRDQGRLEIKERAGLTHLKPIVIGDAPIRSTKGDKKFYRTRGEWTEQVLNDTMLTPAERLVAVGVAALVDPGSGRCFAGQSEIARSLGVARMTVIRSVPKLVQRSLIQTLSLPGGEQIHTPLQHPSSQEVPQGVSQEVPQGVQHGEADLVVISDSCSTIFRDSGVSTDSGDSDDIPTLTESAPVAARRERGREDLSDFQTVYDIISLYGRDDRMRIGGVINCAEHPGSNIHLTFESDIQPAINAGFLKREGNYISLTDAGIDYGRGGMTSQKAA
jgi:hypothetical protein